MTKFPVKTNIPGYFIGVNELWLKRSTFEEPFINITEVDRVFQKIEENFAKIIKYTESDFFFIYNCFKEKSLPDHFVIVNNSVTQLHYFFSKKLKKSEDFSTIEKMVFVKNILLLKQKYGNLTLNCTYGPIAKINTQLPKQTIELGEELSIKIIHIINTIKKYTGELSQGWIQGILPRRIS